MMKYLLLNMFMALAVLTTLANNRLYIEDFDIQAGETLQVPVLLVNDTVYSGLQTDLYLPAGLTLDMEDDEYIIDLTDRANRYHSVVAYPQPDGALRIFVSSMNVKDFNDNSGAIMTMSITAAQDFTGPADIFLKNTICAESIGTKHMLADESCRVNGGNEDIISGDVDGDGRVNIGDVTLLINYLLSHNATGVNLDAADCDPDSSVNISDVTALINFLLSGTWN